jgi:hypothetical protein
MNAEKQFDPRKQRLSYATGSPKPYTLPKLTQLQLAVLACVRDAEVVPYIKYVPDKSWRGPVQAHKAHGFDVTSQINSLRKRKLIKFTNYYYARLNFAGVVYGLTENGATELTQHSEF